MFVTLKILYCNSLDLVVPVVIFCGIGGRASFAKASLEALEYEKILNAGGLMDLGYLVKSG